MNKRKILILLICLIQFYSFVYSNNNIEVNNEVNNKELKISQLNELNSSYHFIFNSELESISIQIKVFDKNNELIWFSSKLDNIDTFELINFDFYSLDNTLKESNLYTLKVHKTYHHFESNNTQSSYIDIFTIIK